MIGIKATLRQRMSAHEARFAGELVDGARILALFGDVATELLVRLDGDEGLLRAYDSIEFLAPVFAGDFIEVTGQLVAVGSTSRKLRFEARKVISNVRARGLPPSAAAVLDEPAVVARAVGTCVVPEQQQRSPRELYMPGLPAGPAPETAALVTPEAGDDVVLTAAIIGELSRRQTPCLPSSAREIADEAARCRDAGAAVIHLRVRDDGQSAQSSDRVAQVIEAVRAKCDCILQPSTGAMEGTTVADRARPLACRPEMATLDCGTINFGEDVLVNSRADIRRLAAHIRAAGAAPELECYEVGHIEEALSLAAEGAVERPAHLRFVLGVKGAIPAREDVLQLMRALVPMDATWGVAAVGRAQQPMTELAMRLGGHARVGAEDKDDGAKGALLEGVAPLVARAAAFARSIGRQPADPARARAILGLRGPE